MIKRLMSADALMLMLLSSNICAAKNPRSIEPNKPAMPNMSEVFDKEEIYIMAQHPDKFYAYLSKDLIECFRNMPKVKDMPEVIEVMCEHMKKYKSADYDFTCNVIEEALKYCQDQAQIDILQAYKADLESGEAILTVDPSSKTRKCHSKKCLRLCRLIVRDCIRTCSLVVRKDAAIGGNLAVAGDSAIDGSETIGNNLEVGNDLTVKGTTNLLADTTVTDLYSTNIFNSNNITNDGILTVKGKTNLKDTTVTDLHSTSIDNSGDISTLNLIATGETNLRDTNINGIVKINDCNPALNCAESIKLIRSTIEIPTNATFTVMADDAIPVRNITVSNDNDSAPDIILGAGFNAPGVIAGTGLNATGIGIYDQDAVSGADYIYVNLSFPLTFAAQFAAIPSVSLNMYGDNIVADTLNNLIKRDGANAAALDFITVSPSNVFLGGFTVNLTFGFTVSTQINDNSPIPGIMTILNNILSGLKISTLVTGN